MSSRTKRWEYDGYSGYLPVPMWENGRWVPVYCPTGEEMPWPEGFSESEIRRPKYQLGQQVRFDWGGKIVSGDIRQIKLWGGTYYGYELRYDWKEKRELTVADLCRRRYSAEPTYTVHWQGHGRWVDEGKIIA